MKKLLAIMFACLMLIMLTGCVNFSSGEHKGKLVKLSEKGIIWKTLEGQLDLGCVQVTGQTGENNCLFRFSIEKDNRALFDVLNEKVGEEVKLHYEQELIVAPWRADTSYIVTSLE